MRTFLRATWADLLFGAVLGMTAPVIYEAATALVCPPSLEVFDSYERRAHGMGGSLGLALFVLWAAFVLSRWHRRRA